MSETEGEISETLRLFPECKSYADVYDRFRLLSERMILAHAIHLREDEIQLLIERKCGISHCPTSNINLQSGVFRLMEMTQRGLKIGLGSDVSGGYAVGLLPVLREASTVSRTLALQDAKQKPAPLEALYYFATLGGAQVCGLDQRIGKLAPGYDFDALVVNTFPFGDAVVPENPGLFAFDTEPLASQFEKWIFCGDDRNIAAVLVRGEVVSGNLPRVAQAH